MPTLEELTRGLKYTDTYAPPQARGDVSTGASPYRVPIPATTDIPEPRYSPSPEIAARFGGVVKKPKPVSLKGESDDVRLSRIMSAVVYSPTPVVRFEGAPSTVLPLARAGISVGRDEQGQYPVAIDLSKINLGDLDWFAQRQRGG